MDSNFKLELQTFIDENFIINNQEQHSIVDSLKSKLFQKIFGRISDDILQSANGDTFDNSNMSKLNKILNSKSPTFSETLMNFIDERGLKDSDVYNKAGISRQLFSKIRIHPNYKPTKPTILLFALAMELDLDDTQELLASAGFTLSHSSKQDLIIEFLITKGIHDIFTVNDVLYEFKQPTLGT